MILVGHRCIIPASHVLLRLLFYILITMVQGVLLGVQPPSDEAAAAAAASDLDLDPGPAPMASSSWDEDTLDFQLELYPPEIENLLVDSELNVHINCSMTPPPSSSSYDLSVLPTAPSLNVSSQRSLAQEIAGANDNSSSSSSTAQAQVARMELNLEELLNRTYIATITSQNTKVAIVTGPDDLVQRVDNRSDEVMLEINPLSETMFTVKAQHIGHTQMVIKVQSFYSYLDDMFNMSESDVRTISVVEYRVTVIRRMRTVDTVFDLVISVVAFLNSFSMGCLTDWPSLRYHLKHPSALLIGLACQFLVMPSIALGLAKSLAMSREEGLGLFYVACVPAGGAGHIVVSIISGDRALSVALNFFSTVMAVASAPLWVFGLGRFLGLTDSLVKVLVEFELWLGGSAIAYMLGILLNHVKPSVAHGFLNWIVKPWLLLFTIIFSTIGMYINVYMFAFIDPRAPIAAGMLPILGYAVGIMIAFLSRQTYEYLKTITTEATFSNCLLVLAMVRFSFPQPEADIVSSMPMWVIYLMPIPFLTTFMVQGIKKVLLDHCDRRREKKYRNFSIVSSLLNVTNVTTLSASITPKMNSPIDDSTMLIDEKITVL